MTPLTAARSVVEEAESKLRGLLIDAAGDKEAGYAIQSAIDGLHDYGHEIHAEIDNRERDARIEQLEQKAAAEDNLYWLNQGNAHSDKVA